MRLIFTNFVLASFAFLTANADPFEASCVECRKQFGLLVEMTNTFTKDVDPSIDGLLFKADGDSFFWLESNIDSLGDPRPFRENQAYQNLIFENSSTANAWDLSAIVTTDKQTNDLITNLITRSLTLNDTTLAFTRTIFGTGGQFTGYVGFSASRKAQAKARA